MPNKEVNEGSVIGRVALYLYNVATGFFDMKLTGVDGKAHVITNQIDSVTGLPAEQKNRDGAAVVTTTGASGASKDRIQTLSAVTTRQRLTWPAGTGPKHIMLVTNHADFCKVTFNAPSTAAADSSLAEAYDGTFNLTHVKFNNASAIEEREFVFSAPLETLDFLPTTNHTEFKVLGI